MKKKKYILVTFLIIIFILILIGAIHILFLKKDIDPHIHSVDRVNTKDNQEKISPTISTEVSPTPTTKPEEISSKYPIHKGIYATMFWVGEKASEANDYIPNESSAWDRNWMENYGGIDNPYSRNGYYPSDFVPKENPFYFALPYNDFSDSTKRSDANLLPWSASENQSAVKNKWIKVSYKNNICYGQWEDVGPFEQDDFDYVFGGAAPKNKRAGLDLSPALRTCLRMATNDDVDWSFIDEADVPDGPWKDIVTTSQVNW